MTAFSPWEWGSVEGDSWKWEKRRCCTIELDGLIGTRLNTMISFVPEHKSATSSQPLLEYTAVMTNSQGREYGLFFVFAISVLSCLTCTFVNVVNSSVALLTSKSHSQFCQTFIIIDVNPDASTQCPYMPFWSSLYERCRGKLPGCCHSNVFGWVHL